MFFLGFGMLVIVAVVPTLAQRLGPAASRRLVLGLGVAAATVGWFSLAYLVWGPTYSVYRVSTSSDGGQSAVTFTRSLAEEGLSPLTTAVLIAEAGAFASLVIGAMAHRGGRRWGRRLMVASLAIPVTVGFISFGLASVIPAVLLGGMATAFAFPRRRSPGRP